MTIELLENSSLCSSEVLLYKVSNADEIDKRIKKMTHKDTFTIVHKTGFTEAIKTEFGIFFGTTHVGLVSNSLKSFIHDNIWLIPRPKYDDLETLISLDKKVFDEYGSEFFCSLCWNTRTKKYEIFVPKQSVSGASVAFEQFIPEHLIQVIDHHSHNDMGAFFSTVDNKNDALRFKISMVIGRVTSTKPEIVMRLVLSGKVYEVTPYNIFEGIIYTDVEELYQTKVKDKIQKKKSSYNNFYKNNKGIFTQTDKGIAFHFDDEKEKDFSDPDSCLITY